MTYLRDRVIGNFKPSPTEKQKAKAAKPRLKREGRDGNDLKHLAAVRLCPCCIPGCNRVGGNDPHHTKVAGGRGTGMKAPDRWVVPLCRTHHDEVERLGSRREAGWFRSHGIEVIDLAASLWAARGDSAAMTKIILVAKGNRA